MASRVTLYDLEHVTDYLGFESFCNDLMSREGYKSIAAYVDSRPTSLALLSVLSPTNAELRSLPSFVHS